MNGHTNISVLARVISLVSAVLLSSCSVYFAASGSKNPDFDRIKPGASRQTVEEELGSAMESKATHAGEEVVYAYKTGDHPALGRAVLYLLGDIVTFCLAEYIFFPLEISQSGDAHQVSVEYGSDGRARLIKQVD